MKKIILLFSLLLIGSQIVCAQSDELQLRKAGIGLSIATFNFFEMYEYDYITDLNKLTVPVNLSQHFRIEPEVSAAYSSRYDEFYVYGGVGVFYQKQKQDFNIYTGPRLGLGYNDYEELQTHIAPVFGAEYYFSDRFCVGGELQLKLLLMKDTGPWGTDRDMILSLITPISFKFYP